MKRPKIYISGPISRGVPEVNFNQASRAHRDLIDAGFAPLNPILSMRLEWHEQVAHADWIDCDLPWVACADAVLLLPGKSLGAEIECRYALQEGVPIYRDIADLVADRDKLGQPIPAEVAPAKTDEEIRAERGKVYGDPLDNHRGIAQMWAPILQPYAEAIANGDPVPAHVVALLFVLLKVDRMRLVYHEDNYADARNYLSFAQEWQSNGNE